MVLLGNESFEARKLIRDSTYGSGAKLVFSFFM